MVGIDFKYAYSSYAFDRFTIDYRPCRIGWIGILEYCIRKRGNQFRIQLKTIMFQQICCYQVAGATMIHRNSTGYVTGYGGYHYEELSWLAHRLNFRFVLILILVFFPHKSRIVCICLFTSVKDIIIPSNSVIHSENVIDHLGHHLP